MYGSTCRAYANRGKLEVLVLRPTHIVFPPEFPELEARGADVQNYHLWAYIAPEDVAQGFCCALNSPGGGHATCFLPADGLNTRPTIELLRERYGALPTVRDATYFETNPCASVLDGRRAQDRQVRAEDQLA